MKEAEVFADALYLKLLREEVPSKEAFNKILLEAFGKKASSQALDWKTNIADYIVACRADKGLPFFKTRYAGQPLMTADGRRVVLGICFGGEGTIEHRWFVNVPKEDIELMEAAYGDWKSLIHKYGNPDQIRKAFEAPVIL